MRHVFVYGCAAGSTTSAIIRAWCPAPTRAACGDVYAIDERLVPVLDEIEEVYPGVEGLFLSRQTTVALAGQRYDCLYHPVGEHSVADRPRIASGDWVAHRLARQLQAELQAG